jgi:hypothetical protein
MTIPAPHGRSWLNRRAPILGSLLALLILLPVGVLFAAHWRDLSTQREFASHERHGIEYLMSLGQLTVALTDAQSAAVSGQPLPGDALSRSLAATGESDEQVGGMHRMSDRWEQLHHTIEQAAGTEYADPREAYDRYGEATELLLAHHSKLRETSGLSRDAEADTYYLQDAASEELPETIVAAGRLVDLATMGAATDEISVARISLTGPADDLAGDLQAALESTASRTLSSSVLSKLDRFLRDKDALLAAVPPDEAPAEVDTTRLSVLRIELQAAAIDLVNALLVETDALLATRIDEIERRQLTATLAIVGAAVLVLALGWVQLAGARWRSRPGRTPEPTAPPEPDVVRAELVEWERSGAR